jgi:CelD/BcsL family acetyltransferase involved in cellulose biosynthesis
MSEIALTGPARRGVPATAAKRTASRHVLVAEVLFGVEAYEKLRADWQRLVQLQTSTILFQTPALLAPWAHHFASNRGASLATVVVRDEDRTVLIWPLVVARRGLFRIACGAGAPIGQYDEILLDPDYDGQAAITAALGTLHETVRPDVVSVERVRTDSALRDALHDVPPLSWAEGAPYVDLTHGVEGVKANQKSRVSRQQRKRVRRFEELGGADFRVADNPDEAEVWLGEALALKRDWLSRTGRVSRAFLKPETASCLIDLARTLCSADASPRMVVSKLSVKGRTAAIEAGFGHRDWYHLYLGAFAPEFAKLGPGNVITEKMIEWCVANGLTRYDMLAPRSRYKSEWQTNEVAVVDFALPLTMRGRIYATLVMKRLRPAMRDVFYALPPRARTFIAGLTLRMQTG